MEEKARLEMVELLGEINMFQDLDHEEREYLTAMMDQEQFESGRELFREGDPGGKLYIIANGSVEVQKQRSYGAGRIVIARFERGGVIGEMSLMDRMPRSASVTAAQSTRVFILTQEALDKLMEEKPQLAIKLLKGLAVLLSLRLRNTSGWFADVF